MDGKEIVLEPCPFCGSKAFHDSHKNEEMILCSGCFAQMRYDGSGEAIMAMWNTRVPKEKGD
ncbi:Lar family restriction alleviation protein [Candidatus Pacearchaeota archaeon]|nr:Lar family restriction alleviation protein [Candidatus Pacearchaeota archaeon]